MASNVTVESETLEAFLPDLVTAICDDVQRITDQCLSSGLISDSRRRRILELKGSEDQARALVQCVQNSTKTDSRCFEIFLDSLDRELPRLVKEKLLSDMRRDLAERAAIRKAVVPAAVFQKRHQENDRLQCMHQQSSHFGRYESSVKKHAHASAEKDLYEQSLQLKIEERGRLRSNLEVMKSQSSEVEAKEIESTKERLSACEMKMTEIKERIEKLEEIIQEEDMQARRGKGIIMVGTKVFAKMTEEQFAAALIEKEDEHKRLLKEREDELRQKMQEEMDTKIRDLEHKVALQERDYKMALQEKELQIKELELNKAIMRRSHKAKSASLVGPQIPNVFAQGVDTKLDGVSLINIVEPQHWQTKRLTDTHLPILLKQLAKHSTDWKRIGSYLGFSSGELNDINTRPLLIQDAPTSWLSAMLAQWLQWAPGDSRGSTSFATLEALKTALSQSGLGATAHDLEI